jgi:hypothetical protein
VQVPCARYDTVEPLTPQTPGVELVTDVAPSPLVVTCGMNVVPNDALAGRFEMVGTEDDARTTATVPSA